mgnify:CR=1 FL=1
MPMKITPSLYLGILVSLAACQLISMAADASEPLNVTPKRGKRRTSEDFANLERQASPQLTDFERRHGERIRAIAQKFPALVSSTYSESLARFEQVRRKAFASRELQAVLMAAVKVSSPPGQTKANPETAKQLFAEYEARFKAEVIKLDPSLTDFLNQEQSFYAEAAKEFPEIKKLANWRLLLSRKSNQ